MLVCVTVSGIHAQRRFFINIGGSDANGNWKNRNIHHDRQAELDGWAHISQVESRCTRMTRRCGLENSSENSRTRGEIIHGGIVQVQHNNENNIDRVHKEQDSEENPRRPAWEKQRVTPSRMIEQESEWIFQRGFGRANFVENPDNKSKKTRVTGVPGKCKETHKNHWEGRILKRNHRIWR